MTGRLSQAMREERIGEMGEPRVKEIIAKWLDYIGKRRRGKRKAQFSPWAGQFRVGD